MRRFHLCIAGLSAIAMVGAIANKALLQPAPPEGQPPTPNPAGSQPTPAPNASPALPGDPPASPSAPPVSPGNPPALPDNLPASPSAPPSRPADSLPARTALVDAVAKAVINQFQTVSCEELAQMQPSDAKEPAAGSDPQAAMQEKAIALLKSNPQIREQFINQVAPAIANCMFDCNIIP